MATAARGRCRRPRQPLRLFAAPGEEHRLGERGCRTIQNRYCADTGYAAWRANGHRLRGALVQVIYRCTRGTQGLDSRHVGCAPPSCRASANPGSSRLGVCIQEIGEGRNRPILLKNSDLRAKRELTKNPVWSCARSPVMTSRFELRQEEFSWELHYLLVSRLRIWRQIANPKLLIFKTEFFNRIGQQQPFRLIKIWHFRWIKLQNNMNWTITDRADLVDISS